MAFSPTRMSERRDEARVPEMLQGGHLHHRALHGVEALASFFCHYGVLQVDLPSAYGVLLGRFAALRVWQAVGIQQT